MAKLPGKKPKPSKLKVLNGNPGRRPLNEHEPEPEVCLVSPPAHLDEIALKEWHRVARELYELGLLTSLDRSILAAYCNAYSQWVIAKRHIDERGLTIITAKGNEIANPSVGIANTAVGIMERLGTEFGMTPSSRSRISVPKKPEKNKWAARFGGGK